MADSFSLDNGGNVVLQEPGRSGGVPQTGSNAQAPGVQAAEAPQTARGTINELARAFGSQQTSSGVLTAVAKLADGALNKFVQQKTTEAYFDGMAKVVQGRALQEITQEEPWYSKIFGPSATLRGAQAMAVQSAVGDSQTQFMQDLPALSTKSPDEVRKYLVKQAAAVDIGDPAMNAVVQAKIAEGWQPMLELHMKKHYAYIQQENVNSYAKLQTSNGSQLQELAKQGEGMLSSQTGQQLKAQLNASLDERFGMDEQTYKKALPEVQGQQLAQGNFVWNRMFMESPAFQKLDPEAQQKAFDATARYESRALQQYEFDQWGRAKVNIKLAAKAGTMSGNEVIQAAELINKRFASMTGISQPFFSQKELESTIGGVGDALIRGEVRQDAKNTKLSEAADKQLAIDEQTRFTQASVQAGDPLKALQLGTKANDLDLEIAASYNRQATQDPTAAADLLIRNYNASPSAGQSKQLAEQWQTPLVANIQSGEGLSDGVLAAHQNFKAIADRPGGVATAVAYFGEFGPKMLKFDAAMKGGIPPAVAYNSAFIAAPTLGNLGRQTGGAKAANEAIDAAVSSNHLPGFFSRTLLGENRLNDYAARLVRESSLGIMDQYLQPGTSMDVKTAAEVAVKQAHIDVVGTDAYVKGRNQRYPLSHDVGIPQESMGDVVGGIRDRKLKELGVSASQIQNVIRPANSNDLLYIAATDDNELVTFRIAGHDMESEYKRVRGELKTAEQKAPISRAVITRNRDIIEQLGPR